MMALTYDRGSDPWETTVGLKKTEVERPRIEEGKDYRDRASVLVEPMMTGFCGSDRGIWFRSAFKEMIFKSLDRDKKDVRTIGHELLGRVVDLGSEARRSYGLEVLLRRPLSKRLSGLLSYTLSRATREAHFITPAGVDEAVSVPNEFDRTHVFNAILAYDLGRRWRAGTRLLFYTGTPYSHLDGSIPVPPYHAYRNPDFYRVDIRLEKRWRLGQDGSIAFVLEGQNVTLSKEISSLGMDCEGRGTPEAATTECKYSTIGPLTIPSVGVEAFF